MGEHNVGRDPDCQGDGNKECAPPAIKRKIAKTIPHENYIEKPSTKNDIALIRLEKPVPLFIEDPSTSYASVVCLPWKSNDPGRDLEEGTNILVTGWGRYHNNNFKNDQGIIANKVSSQTLRKATVPVANSRCTEAGNFKIDTDKQICAGGDKGIVQNQLTLTYTNSSTELHYNE